MQTVPLNIAGPTGASISGQNNPQVTRNFFIQATPAGVSDYILLPTPGQLAFCAQAAAHRGSVEYLGQTYAVNGTSLISINSSGTATVRGVVPGSGRCIFAPIFDTSLEAYGLIISTEGRRYYYNQSTVALMSDVDLYAGNSVAVMNDVAIFDATNGDLVHSVYGDPTNVSSFFATANTNQDELVRVYVFGQLVYAMGDRTVELWAYNGATTEFIFTRQEQATITVGLGACYSVANDKDFVYFLGSDKMFYRLKSAFAEPISTPEITQAVERFATYDDAEGYCYQQDGQHFYHVTFPAADKSFLFNASNGTWTEVCSGLSAGRHNTGSLVNCYGKNYVFDADTGSCFELKSGLFADDGDTIRRERITAVLHGGVFGAPGKRIFYGMLELICEIGVGLATGQGVNPLVMMSYSDDGGKTWSAELDGEMGEMGDYHYTVRWHGLGSAYKRVFRFAITDPVFASFHSATVDVEAGTS